MLVCWYPNLYVGSEFLKNLIDLVLKSTTQHLVSFIQDKHFDVL